MNRNAISLFSSSGIADLGVRANGVDVVIACELIKKRMDLFSLNYPETKCFQGDIWQLKEDLVKFYNNKYTEPPFLILATPPCQGMSSNGMGKMLSDYRKGLRPKMDERNRLIIPAIEIIKKLCPEWVIFENVSNMGNTLIYDNQDNLINILDYISRELQGYIGQSKIINAADFGVPQQRKRLITIYTRNKKAIELFKSTNNLFPEPTHSQFETKFYKKWITLKEAIGDLPELRSEKGKEVDAIFNPLHKVPILDEKKLYWIDNTPEGETAFNNQCVHCGFQGNKNHGASINAEGINKFNSETPLYCQKCGELLPRPWVEDKFTKEKRLMKGYVSAYKRMRWDEPASTITQNFQYACSDNKIHPTQSRVLSIYEALIIQSISNYKYRFDNGGKFVLKSLITDIIGESIPPKIIDIICKHIIYITQ